MQYGRVVLYVSIIAILATSGYFIFTSIFSDSFDQCKPYSDSNCDAAAKAVLEVYPGAISSADKTKLTISNDGIYKPVETEVDTWLFTIDLENSIMFNGVETSHIRAYVNTNNISQRWIGVMG